MGRISNKTKLAVKLRQKSIESFMLCLEIYNKPTINYRIEASSFLICNAWELMLKSHYILKNGEKSIFRKSDGKTFSLEEMLVKYYDQNHPIRKNLDYIIEKIRNKSTHFIVREHDLLYTPLLQKAVLNFVEELKIKLNYDITDLIPLESLALLVKKVDLPKNISKMYGKSFSKIYEQDKRAFDEFIQTNVKDGEGCEVVAVVESRLSFVKNAKEADIKAHYDSGGLALQKIIISKDINDSHPYRMKQVIKIIKDEIGKIYNLSSLHSNSLNKFNKEHKITKKPEFFAQVEYSVNPIKKYSRKYIDYIIECVKQNPDLFKK